MPNRRCNPYLDTRLTVSRVLLMTLATIVFIGGVIYGVVRGTFWRLCGKNKENQFRDFHEAMHKMFKFDLYLHPWLHCDVHNPYGEKFERGAIAICNHQSLLDTLCLLILSPKLLIVTGERVWNNFIIKPVLHFAEFTCVNRTMPEMLKYCRQHIDNGYTVVIFPEGERSLDGHILRFHSGAFQLAKELKADILPLYMHGTGYVLPLHKAFQNKAKLYMEIGQRIAYDAPVRGTDVRKQANTFRSHYQSYYEAICKERETTDYFTYLVGNLYGRIGKRKYASNLLKQYENFSEWIDRSFEDVSSIWIEDYSDGVFTLMFALVHPNLDVYSSGTVGLRKLYRKCKHLPANVIFMDEADRMVTEQKTLFFSIAHVANVLTYKQ